MQKKFGDVVGHNLRYSMFHVTWTTFKLNRNRLGTVPEFVMCLWLIAPLMCTLNPFSMGFFENTTVLGGGGGALWPPLVTLVFLKVEGQNLVAWGILMCFLEKWH